MSIPVWFNCGRGTWDQGLTEAAITGALWPLPVDFEVVDQPRPNGVMVVHGEVARGQDVPAPPPGTVLIHTSDEHLSWNSARYRSDVVRTWLMHANPVKDTPHDRKIAPGWPPGTLEGLAGLERLEPARRRLWAFAGQVQNDSRRECVRVLKDQRHGELRVSGGFAQGLPRSEYLKLLSQTAILPSPAGNVNPEGFRLYEGLEAGCLPVAQRSFPGWPERFDWWTWQYGEAPPFPVVDSWRELPAILARLHEDGTGALQRETTAARSWWIRYKRRFALELVADCRALGYHGPESPVTVLIPSSPVASHPSTAMLEDTIRRVRAYPEFARAEVIVMLDGVRDEQRHRMADYEEYKRRVVDLCTFDPAFFGVLPLPFDRHTHQAGMARAALDLVQTPLVFYVEHDTWPMGEIPFDRLMRTFDREAGINVVRLHLDHKILPEHEYLMHGEMEVEDCPLTRTTGWSQRPHLARTDFYRRILRDHFAPDSVCMVEDGLYGYVAEAPWERYGVTIYTPPGNTLRSGSSDGRGVDPKYDMRHVEPGTGRVRIIGGTPGRE